MDNKQTWVAQRKSREFGWHIKRLSGMQGCMFMQTWWGCLEGVVAAFLQWTDTPELSRGELYWQNWPTASGAAVIQHCHADHKAVQSWLLPLFMYLLTTLVYQLACSLRKSKKSLHKASFLFISILSNRNQGPLGWQEFNHGLQLTLRKSAKCGSR